MELFWLDEQREQLRQARAAGRLPHAVLIHDVPGGGGEQLALYAARLALCESGAAPCGECRSCRMLVTAAADNVESLQHPDLHWLMPLRDGEKTSQHISIAQVRALGEELVKTSHGGRGVSVAILSPADSLLPPAANALLKTLEEPRPGTLIILLTAAPGRLLATLRSRCLKLRIRVPPRAQLVSWLQRSVGKGDWSAVLEVLGDAPLLAAAADVRRLADMRRDTHGALERIAAASPLALNELATQWSRADQLPLRLACIENWITLRIAAYATKNSDSVAKPTGAHLSEYGPASNIAALVRAHDAARELGRMAATPINKALSLELLFWQLSRSANQ